MSVSRIRCHRRRIASRACMVVVVMVSAWVSAPAFALPSECDQRDESALNRFEWSGWLEYQVARLGNPLVSDRVAAVRCLAYFPPGQATPHLVKALGDESLDVQVAALKALGESGARDAVDQVTAQLDSRTAEVRTAAAEALGKLGVRTASDRLLTALSDSSAEVRLAAVRALGALRDPAAILALTAALDDDSKEVVVAALDELGRFADRTTVPAVLDKTRDPAVKVQVASIKALGVLRDPRATSALVALVRSPSGEVRRAALKAIAEAGDPAAVEPLHALLTPTSGEDTLLYVVKALGRLRDARSVEPLLMAVRRNLQPVAAADALVEIGAAAVPLLVDELNTTDDEAFQAQLLRLLARIPGASSAETLENALLSGRFDRESVVLAVAQVRSRDMLETLALVLPELTDRELVATLRAVAPVADDRLVKPLVERYPKANPALRRAMLAIFAQVADPSALPIVVEELGSEDVEVKRAAIFAAQALGAPEAVEGLARALNADDARGRQEAAVALAAIRDEKAVDKLLAAARKEEHPARRDAMWALAFAARGVDAERARRYVGEVLSDPSNPLAYAALDAAATLRPEGLTTSLDDLFAAGRVSLKRKVLEVAQIVSAQGGDAVDGATGMVGEALQSSEEPLVAEAAWAAGTLGVDASGSERLVALAWSPSGPASCNALATLARRGDRSVLPLLHERLFDQNPFVASNALWGLVQLGEPPARGDLDVLLYRTENPFLRETIYRTLLSQGERDWVQAALSREPNGAVAGIVTALLEGRDPLAVPGHDDWVVIDLTGPDGGRAIAEEVYLLLPDGSIKAAYSDENGKIRLELGGPGVVRQLYGRMPFEERGAELLE